MGYGTVPVGGAPSGLAYDGAGGLWVASRLTPTTAAASGTRTAVFRMEESTGDPSAPVEIGLVRGVTPLGVALWVADRTQGSLLRIE